jgi:hypothetical protein
LGLGLGLGLGSGGRHDMGIDRQSLSIMCTTLTVTSFVLPLCLLEPQCIHPGIQNAVQEMETVPKQMETVPKQMETVPKNGDVPFPSWGPFVRP